MLSTIGTSSLAMMVSLVQSSGHRIEAIDDRIYSTTTQVLEPWVRIKLSGSDAK